MHNLLAVKKKRTTKHLNRIICVYYNCNKSYKQSKEPKSHSKQEKKLLNKLFELEYTIHSLSHTKNRKEPVCAQRMSEILFTALHKTETQRND